jgi:hypothetical protein
MPNFAKSLLVGFCLALASCSGGEAVEDARKDIDTFHQRLDAGQVEEIWKYTSGDINETTTIQEFGGFLAHVHTQLGKVVSTKQTGWKRNLNDKGNFVTVNMETTFERGIGKEEFVFRLVEEKSLLAVYHIKWNNGAEGAEGEKGSGDAGGEAEDIPGTNET